VFSILVNSKHVLIEGNVTHTDYKDIFPGIYLCKIVMLYNRRYKLAVKCIQINCWVYTKNKVFVLNNSINKRS
jgi:hypothetical protein